MEHNLVNEHMASVSLQSIFDRGLRNYASIFAVGKLVYQGVDPDDAVYLGSYGGWHWP